jgi:tetratricopeptide (TPR) repeat protein
VERQLREAENALPEAVEPLILLRLDVLAAQGRLDDARSLLSSALAKEPRNLRYRLSLARLTQRQGQGPAALAILDQAEKDLGPSLDLRLARLDYWGLEGGVAARSAVAKLAETRRNLPAADRPALLDQLGSAEIRLGQSKLARQYWRELADLQPDNVAVRFGLFDLALAAGDHDDARKLVDEIHKVEGDEGLSWQFARAALLIDKLRRGASENLDEARRIADEISRRRPRGAGGFALSGEIAELAGSIEQAIEAYTRAIELGNVQPSLVRRLVALLNERNRSDEIDHVAEMLRDQGAALDEITIVKALAAIRNQDFDRGIALAQQAFPDDSTSYLDHLNLGRIYMAAGRSDEAGKRFRRATELGPGTPLSWLTYVQYLVQIKRPDQAQVAVEGARHALPADRATLTLAQCSLLLGDTQQADELVKKAMKEKGKAADPAELRLAAAVALRRNRLDQVDEYLTELGRVADLSPDDKVWANRTRVALLMAKGRAADRDRALAVLDENLVINRDSIADLGLKATVLALRPSGHGAAIKILEQLASANGLGANERFLLAQLYLGQRDGQKYQGEMQKLLDLNLKDPRHLAHFANFWIGRNQLDQAERWLAELKKAEPEGRLALELEARLLDLRTRKGELLALLETRGREVPDLIGPVADLLNRYGFTKEAEAAYKAFVAREPRQPERVLALATHFARQDRVAEALTILKTAWSTCRHEQVSVVALELYDAPSAGEAERRQVEAWVSEAAQKRPDAISLASKLGLIWVRRGRFDEAEGLFRRLLVGDPDNADVLNNLAWLLALRDKGKAQQALALINRAIDVAGTVPSLVDTRAVVLIRAGQLDKAVEDLGNARASNATNPSYALHLAWAYQASGQTERARLQLQEAEKLGLRPRALDPLELAVLQNLRSELSPG